MNNSISYQASVNQKTTLERGLHNTLMVTSEYQMRHFGALQGGNQARGSIDSLKRLQKTITANKIQELKDILKEFNNPDFYFKSSGFGDPIDQ